MIAPKNVGLIFLYMVVFLFARALSGGSKAFSTSNRSNIVYPSDTKLKRVDIPPPPPRPEYLKPVVDPVFKTRVVRISDSKAFKTSKTTVRHNYSKREAFNSDGTLIMLANRYLLDGRTFKLVGLYNEASSECAWSNLKPYLMHDLVRSKGEFISLDIRNNRRKKIYRFKGFDDLYMGRWEGNMSIDDKYVAFMGKKGKDLYVITFNVAKKRIVAVRKFPNRWKRKSPQIDWVSFSQSGDYVLINWENDGKGRCSGVEVFDKKMRFLRQLVPRGEHGDIGYDSQGDEVFVQMTCGARRKYKGEIISIRLKDGKITRVLDSSAGGFGGHISCRNIKRPGWAYVSAGRPLYEVFAVKLDGSQTVERFAHTYSYDKSYNAESQAVPNRKGDKVIFASHWPGANGIYAYITYMPGTSIRKNGKKVR